MAVIAEERLKKPIGMRNVQLTRRQYKILVLILTFFAYASYHATRKIPSIVKSVLDPRTPELGFFPWRNPHYLRSVGPRLEEAGLENGWAPFNGPDGNTLLGVIDVAFLSVYAIGTYFTGHLGDRLDLSVLLMIGMTGTAIFTALFGAGYWLNIHNFYYFLVIQMFAGVFQSTGWPSVVAVVGKWFGKSKRGLIMGIWNAHTSIGNITGSLIAAALLEFGWGWSFLVPSVIMAIIGLIVFMFLPVSPQAVGAEKKIKVLDNGENTQPLLEPARQEGKEKAVGFLEAWRIPGVAAFATCLFFSKFVAYTFLYWLPFYLSQTAIGGEYLSNSVAGSLSTLFDVGGIVGGVLAGHISDQLDARAITTAGFMLCAIPALFFYRIYGTISLFWNIIIMFISGMLVNGPYALITTAVSADLGTHSSLRGNSQALATVTAIIDGTGSVGAAIGPLLTGYISTISWDAVFFMLMLAALVAALVVSPLVISEVMEKRESARSNISSDVAANV